MIVTFLYAFSIFSITYFALLGAWYTTLLLASFPEVLNKFRETTYGNVEHLIDVQSLIPITIVTPAFNEEKRILNMVNSILQSHYKNVRMIIVSDGSTDGTIALLDREFHLEEVPVIIRETVPTEKIRHCYVSRRNKNLMVLDKEHSPWHCAADSVNAGFNACQTPIMLTIDADTVLEPEALSRMMFTFLSKPHCVAVSGAVYVLNDNIVENGKLLTNLLPEHFVSAVQGVEYLRSFLYGRAGLNVFGGAMCYPGAFTLFETECLRDVGGYDTQNFSYDAEIITKIHHYMRKNNFPHTLNHSPNAFSWTEVPSTLKSFWNQRDKWQRGMWRSVMRHISMFFNPRYGIVGMITFPAYLIFEVLGPVVECLTFITLIVAWIMGDIHTEFLLWFLFLAWGYITLVSVAMVFLNLISFNRYRRWTDTFRVIGLVFTEMLGFRQFRAVCCTVATVKYMFNRLRSKPL